MLASLLGDTLGLLLAADTLSDASSTVLAAPALSLMQSANGSFQIHSARDGVAWLSSAGPQLNKTLLLTHQGGGSVTHSQGTDLLGDFAATSVDYKLPCGAVMTATTRLYDSKTSPGHLVVVFEQQIDRALRTGLSLGSATSTAQREVSLAWPTFRHPGTSRPSPSTTPVRPPNCTFIQRTDFNGGDFQRIVGVPTPQDCCRLCSETSACKLFVWYTEARSGTTGNGTTTHCNLKRELVKKLSDQDNHTAGICHSHSNHRSPGPELNAFTTWGPSGMFNELTRLWSPGALVNTASCGSAGNDKGCDSMGPLVVYDRNMTSLVIAPLDEFMVHAIAAGMDPPLCPGSITLLRQLTFRPDRNFLCVQMRIRFVQVFVGQLRPRLRVSSCPQSWSVVKV